LVYSKSCIQSYTWLSSSASKTLQLSISINKRLKNIPIEIGYETPDGKAVLIEEQQRELVEKNWNSRREAAESF